MAEKTPVNHEEDAATQSVFAVIDPRVKPAVVNLVRLAEQTGALERLQRPLAERMIKYLTEPVTLAELGTYYGISDMWMRKSIHAALDTLAADIFRNRGSEHVEQLRRLQIYGRWKRVRGVKRSH